MPQVPPPGDALWTVADALARLLALEDAIENGALGYATTLADRLELDLRALRVLLERNAA